MLNIVLSIITIDIAQDLLSARTINGDYLACLFQWIIYIYNILTSICKDDDFCQ